MKELVETFLNYLSVERGLSNNTIVSYRKDLNNYIDFIEKNNINSLSKVTKESITGFMLSQKIKGLLQTLLPGGLRR